ncbi:tail fiber domain-containing protein [Pseudomonas sp. SDI]|uniref:tail fiber domain-containing protein n=1 Tax=Pseudomonas sp. SDI TaxID=2170734 RepID=UPI001403876B|nr:tail fiber domain-containing protein [Pseudomonas sp. SDI]
MPLKKTKLSAGLVAGITALGLFNLSHSQNARAENMCGPFVCSPLPGIGELCCMSDERLKQEITPLRDPIAHLQALRGVSYRFKSDGKRDVGLLAQDVEKVYPELIVEQNGYKALDYQKLAAPLIEAVKVLDQRLSALEKQ